MKQGCLRGVWCLTGKVVSERCCAVFDREGGV